MEPTTEQLEQWRAHLGKLLWAMEDAFDENPAGTYPPEIVMTTRLAWNSLGRAVRQAREPRPEVPALAETEAS